MKSAPVARLLIILGATVVLLYVCHYAIESGMRRIRTGAFGAFNQVVEGRVNADLVVLGSSRAAMHYDPSILEKATGLSGFNLGRIGARSEVYQGIFAQYLRHNRPPRLVILNADLNSLDLNTVLYDPVEYQPYLDDPDLYRALRQDRGVWQQRHLPLFGYLVDDVEYNHYIGLKALFGIQLPENYHLGYLGVNREWNEARLDVNPAQKWFAYDPEPQAVRQFTAPLAEARSLGITAIVVMSPIQVEFLAKVRKRPELLAAISRACESEQAVFWDMSSMAPVAQDKRYFADSFHMNRRGATLFSERLGQRLAAWLRNHPTRFINAKQDRPN